MFLTSDVVLCTVQHVCSMDELISGPSDPQLSFSVTQNDLSSERRKLLINFCGRRGPEALKVSLLCVAGGWSEVQLVFGPEDHVFGPDLQNRWGLQRSGDGEQSELRQALPSVFWLPVLPVQELESALEVQRLQWKPDPSSNTQKRPHDLLLLHPNKTCL